MAEIVTGVFAETAVVVMVKTGDTDAPPANVTEAGTVACGLLLPRVTTAPPGGADPANVTVLATVDEPPTTEAVDNAIAEIPGGNSVRVAVAGAPL